MAGGGGKDGDLGALLRRSAVDPQRFEELLAAWNAQFDPEKGLPGPASLTAAANDALDAMEGAGEPDEVRPEIARMINVGPAVHHRSRTAGGGQGDAETAGVRRNRQ